MRITGKHIIRACIVATIGSFGILTYINYKELREKEKEEADILDGEDTAEPAPTSEVIVEAAKETVVDLLEFPFSHPVEFCMAAGAGIFAGLNYRAGLNDGTGILDEKQKSSFAWGYANGGRNAFADVASSCGDNEALKNLLNKNLDKYYEEKGISFGDRIYTDQECNDPLVGSYLEKVRAQL